MANGTTVVIDDERCERRTLINFTKEQHEWLRKQAFETNLSMSAIVRRAIRREMENGEKAKPA